MCGAPAYLHIHTCRCTLLCSALEHLHDSRLCQHPSHPYAFVDLSVHTCTHNTHQRYGVPAGPHLCPRGAKGCTHTCACVGTRTRHSCTLTHQHPSPRATWLRMESGSWRGWRGQNPAACPRRPITALSWPRHCVSGLGFSPGPQETPDEEELPPSEACYECKVNGLPPHERPRRSTYGRHQVGRRKAEAR